MVLEVKDLKVEYNNHIAIEDISFKVEEGEYVCVVGEERLWGADGSAE